MLMRPVFLVLERSKIKVISSFIFFFETCAVCVAFFFLSSSILNVIGLRFTGFFIFLEEEMYLVNLLQFSVSFFTP